MVNKLVIVLILIMSNSLFSFADDGSWNKSFTIDGGSIYSDNENTEIELIKEILIFTGKYTKAVFQFKNRSNKAVTVSCGFPVQYDIEAFFGGDSLEVEISHYAPNEKIPVLSYMETLPLEYTDPDDYLFGLTTDIILNNSFNNSREFISSQQTPEDLIFNITQNGKMVRIEKVLLERYAGEEGAGVTFHYKHSLHFKPGEISTVIVKYNQDLYHGSDGMSDTYLWNYVIGTGGTWKGPIGELVLLKPSDWNGSIDELNIIYENDHITLLSSKEYEPERDRTYNLRGFSFDIMEEYEYFENILPVLKKMWINRSKLLIQPTGAVQELVSNISASSYLPDRLSVFTNNGVILKAAFSPAAAFDGLTETSWCENVQGDGIGEYIELTLSEEVWGLSINNGFTRLPAKDWFFDDRNGKNLFNEKVKDDPKGFKDYFIQNNRVKRLSITNTLGQVIYTLNLADQRDIQTFPGIKLSPGTYRFVIEEVYNGTKWKDTCIGEIYFLETENNQKINTITNDQFYIEALQGVILK